MGPVVNLIPLLTAAAILLAGNGLQSTLITLRAAQEGIPPGLIGLMGTTYFIGFIVACFWTGRLVQAVGHIRVFAALAAISSACVLLMAMVLDTYVWLLMRGVMGFCFAGLVTVVESWINASATNENRGQVLSVYRLVDVGAATGSQFVLPLTGVEGFGVFAIMAMALSLSLVPVSLSRRSMPSPPQEFKFDLKRCWIISPMACLGCLSIGLTNGAFRFAGPLYGQAIGLDVTGIAIFMSAGILGGALLQYPLGYLSDRFDRRSIVMAATSGAVVASYLLAKFGGTSPWFNYAGAFMFGAFAAPLYSLSAAQANDRARADEYVLVSSGLIFFFAVGAAIGPFVAAMVIEQFGANFFFTYISIIHAALLVVAAVRMRERKPVPEKKRESFTVSLRASPTSLWSAEHGPEGDPPPAALLGTPSSPSGPAKPQEDADFE